MHLGIIADDFTGGTDIAGFLVQNGLSTIQYIGPPDQNSPSRTDADAVVISLKSRSCPPDTAVHDSLAALAWLQKQQCSRIFFKYCSTFDSTCNGNIGPVTDALMKALKTPLTILAPALPVNGRTVYYGYLFVNGVPLNESGMRHHPVTPMLDANLMRLMESQSRGKAENIPVAVIEAGVEAVRSELARMERHGVQYAIPDCLNDTHLATVAEAASHFPLVTGGSGLGAALARHIVQTNDLCFGNASTRTLVEGKTIILSGSASVMTNAQVARYKETTRSFQLDVRQCIHEPEAYAESILQWVFSSPQEKYAPLVYATTGPEELAKIQKDFGPESSGAAVETLFAQLAIGLKKGGVQNFIVAGGETSGAVVRALGISAFHIGTQIAPGVPWVKAVDQPLALALKSGNFGDEDFFAKAQDMCQWT